MVPAIAMNSLCFDACITETIVCCVNGGFCVGSQPVCMLHRLFIVFRARQPSGPAHPPLACLLYYALAMMNYYRPRPRWFLLLR